MHIHEDKADGEGVKYGVALFDSTQRALRAEKVLRQAGYIIKLIPVPRHLSSDCGVCVRFSWADLPKVSEALQKAGVETAGIHPLKG